MTTHGQANNTQAYRAWCSMKRRCQNKNVKDYAAYGGRGIKVCARWQKFENFFTDMGHPLSGQSLDRKNNSKGYSKSNCRWVTKVVQANNTRRNRRLRFKGETKTVPQWARELGISQKTLTSRVCRKWPVSRIFTQPVRGRPAC